MFKRKPIVSIFWSIRPHPFLTHFLLVLFASFFIGLGSQIEFTLFSTTINCQGLCALLVGMALGSLMGTCAVLSYLIEGLIGIKVFAHESAGWDALFSPMGAYLFGSLFAALIVGVLVERGWGISTWGSLFSAFLGVTIFQLSGLLVYVYQFGWSISLKVFLKPYLPFAFVMILILGLSTPYFWKLVVADD